MNLFSAAAVNWIRAIERAWSADSAVEAANWSEDNPAGGQCEPTTFLAWEVFGGSIVLGEVYVDGVRTEYHHWNRVDGCDVDLTRRQFELGVDIRAVEILTAEEVTERLPKMRPELVARVDRLRSDMRRLTPEPAG